MRSVVATGELVRSDKPREHAYYIIRPSSKLIPSINCFSWRHSRWQGGQGLLTFAVPRSIQEHKSVVRADEKVDSPQCSTQDLRVELALVLPDFRVLPQKKKGEDLDIGSISSNTDRHTHSNSTTVLQQSSKSSHSSTKIRTRTC